VLYNSRNDIDLTFYTSKGLTEIKRDAVLGVLTNEYKTKLIRIQWLISSTSLRIPPSLEYATL
jgi:hypothetical protein